VKAIETRYAGCRFRSRLEARWAVFFDAGNIDWQYEPEGFDLPSGPYLPDFYLPGVFQRAKDQHVGVWFEVKPAPGPADPRWHELADETGKAVYVAYGMPCPPQPNGWIEEFTPDGWDNDMVFCDCWGVISLQYGPESGYHYRPNSHHPHADRLLVAARSARFEWGESG